MVQKLFLSSRLGIYDIILGTDQMQKYKLVFFDYDKVQVMETQVGDARVIQGVRGKKSLKKGTTGEKLEKLMQKAHQGALGTIYSVKSQPPLIESPAESLAIAEPLCTLIREH